MDSTPIISDFENTSIRNVTFFVLSCIGGNRFFQKVVGLKIHQRYCRETKRWNGKPAGEIESLVNNENQSTTETSIEYKRGDKLKTKALKIISSSYIRKLYIGENATNWTCWKTIY